MRCTNCNTPLQDKARFCSTCGTPVVTSGENHTIEDISISSEADEDGTSSEIPKTQTYVNSQPRETNAPALQISLRNTRERETKNSQIYQETSPHLSFLSPNTPSPSLPYFRLDTSNKVRNMLPAVVNPQTAKVPRRKRGGLGCLLTLLVLVVIIAGAWSFVLQPFLHNLAEDQLNQALSAAVNQIPSGASTLPTNSLKISETVINNLIVLNTSPSSPIQSPSTHITPANIRIDFQLYGQPCSITAVPEVQNNRLVATNTTVSGIIGLVLSPNDITSIVNQHLAAAQSRLQHPVKNVQLKDHEVDLTLG
jgi:zinc-ribbon domain